MGYHDNEQGIPKIFKWWYWQKHCRQRKASLDPEEDPTPRRANVSMRKPYKLPLVLRREVRPRGFGVGLCWELGVWELDGDAISVGPSEGYLLRMPWGERGNGLTDIRRTD